jgi:hypothetical protein
VATLDRLLDGPRPNTVLMVDEQSDRPALMQQAIKTTLG